MIVSQTLVQGPTERWLKFDYNEKPRLGLDMGDDERPGTDNLCVHTIDGFRTFKKGQMVRVKDATTVGDWA